MEGDDVTALQTSLSRLGYDLKISGVFDEPSKDAVATFYADAGYDAVPTSETCAADLAVAERTLTDAAAQLALSALDDADNGPAGSEIAAANSAVDAAERSVVGAMATRVESINVAEIALGVVRASRDEVHATQGISVDEYNAANSNVHSAEIALARAFRDNDDAVEAAEDQLEVAVLTRSELDEAIDTAELQIAADAAQMAVAELTRLNGPTIPQGEIVFVTATPARVLGAATSTPDAAPSGSPSDSTALLSLAIGDIVVTSSIRPDQVELVSVSAQVELLDEITNTTYPATISAVAADATEDASGQLGHSISISPNAPLPDDLVGTSLRATFIAASTETEQLVVPVTAVTSSADGTTRVNVLDPATEEPVEVEIIVGVCADGFVAVKPVDTSALDVTSEVIVGR